MKEISPTVEQLKWKTSLKLVNQMDGERDSEEKTKRDSEKRVTTSFEE